ncbi:hypothetical protein KM043_016877 [Ampulex compressa]|nr:hypothetical protein KM043_016877 [Ampulex compressa]
MAKELHRCLVNYFSQLEKLDGRWKELSVAAARPLEALQNQSEQLRHVARKEVDDAELCKIENLREKLIFKILMGLDGEVVLILDIITRFNNANQDLKNRLSNLESIRSKVSLNDEAMKELINGTPYRPRLNLLLEWSISGFNYYHDLYNHINECLKNLDYKNKESVIRLVKSFVEDKHKRAAIDRILTFTQFLIKENGVCTKRLTFVADHRPISRQKGVHAYSGRWGTKALGRRRLILIPLDTVISKVTLAVEGATVANYSSNAKEILAPFFVSPQQDGVYRRAWNFRLIPLKRN